ncbi:right-handed parallel beta-helix repeat-containing protein [Bacillus atrophaeus]|uniref:right-handed parallel beta-helix repeat-containing protein n=1 Tax=Bacillus atrophaeus TaxID=1452 RepID=UPI00032F022E|nr:right-handed parallel beta-helix repeat-containing protein [Bacillus atrophaeus]AKL85480.1 YclG [Bacillus atrophaeus UCMB-5137]
MAEFVLDVTDYGVSGDGKTDSTEMINQCLTAASEKGYHTVWFPKGTYMIDGTLGGDSDQAFRNAGIQVPDDLTILMDPECVIKVIPNDSWGYSAFYVGRKKNITISGGQIIGDRDEHTYKNAGLRQTHEWGFGICIEGSLNILVDNVSISDFTGDGIIVSPRGLKTNPDYTTSENVIIQGCEIRRSRRNNISITGGETVTVQDCIIEDAGKGNGIAPKFGIDIEGYGEGDLDYEEALNITIRNNFFNGNVSSSVCNFNGYGVIIEGNQADNIISYGYGTETLILGNIIKSENGIIQSAGIAGLGVSQGKDGSDAVIESNLITGFSTGIDIRGKSVLAANNKIKNFDNTGISVYQASNVLIEGNIIENGISQTRRSTGFRATLSDDTIFANNSITQVIDGINISGGDITVKQNVLKSFSRGIWVTQGSPVIEGNTLVPNAFEGFMESYAVSITNNASAIIKNNTFRSFKNYPIYCATNARTSIIGNHFEQSPLLVTIYINFGTHDIMDNTITVNRTAGTPIAIYLNSSSGSTISGNTIHNLSANTASAIQTNTSTNSRIIANRIIKGTIVRHSTDISIGNIVV